MQTRWVAHPWESYIFEKRKSYKLVGYKYNYHPYIGKFTTQRRTWGAESRSPWRNTWITNKQIHGLCRDLVDSSAMRDSKLCEYMSGQEFFKKVHAIQYLSTYLEYPQIENIVKQGAVLLLEEMIGESERKTYECAVHGFRDLWWIDFTQKRPSAMLRLNRDEFKRLKEECWCLPLYETYVACRDHGEILTREDIKLLAEFGDENTKYIIGRAPLAKTVRYLFRQIGLSAENYETDPEGMLYDDSLIDYGYLRDYWNSIDEVYGRPMPDLMFPRDLITAHDEMAQRTREKADREFSKQVSAQAKKMSYLSWHDDELGLMIRPAKTQNELVREGEKLHHCVATYAKAVARGETTILFIRRADKPNTPFYTLEYRDGKVAQNRGNRNCARAKEITEFEKRWLKFVKKKEKEINGKRNDKVPA